MKRVLVTGANGQLGQCLQKIVASYPDLEFSFKDAEQLDITDPNNVHAVFDSTPFDYCINCAAYTDVEQAERSPEIAYRVNAEGVKNLALACKKHQAVLIHISTDYVFDGKKKEGYLPSDTPNPINTYGKSKLKGEYYIQEILNAYTIIRTSWLYSEFGTNFYKTVLKKAKAGEKLQITDAQIGCPTHANNLAVYILEVINQDDAHKGIYHFTDGKAMTWYGFAEWILSQHNLLNSVKLVKDKNYRTFAERPKYSVLITTTRDLL